jgi:hypothetical protein
MSPCGNGLKELNLVTPLAVRAAAVDGADLPGLDHR